MFVFEKYFLKRFGGEDMIFWRKTIFEWLSRAQQGKTTNDRDARALSKLTWLATGR
jgi:hypothetical protein